MVFVVHGHIFSTCTARVVSAFFAMGLEADKDFSIVAAEMKDLKTPEWLENQPFGQMPWLEDTENGVKLCESRAMIRYVAAKIGSPLAPAPTPDNLAAYARYEEAAQHENDQFAGPTGTIARELVFAPMRGREGDKAAAAAAQSALGTKLEAYERILSKQKYLAGDRLTVVDFSHLPYGAIAANLGAAPGLTDGSLPNVARWWAEIVNHDAWVKTKALGHPDHGKAQA